MNFCRNRRTNGAKPSNQGKRCDHSCSHYPSDVPRCPSGASSPWGMVCPPVLCAKSRTPEARATQPVDLSPVCVVPTPFFNVGGSKTPRCEFSRPSHEASGVLRQATPWRPERRSLPFRDAVVVPLRPLRQNRRSPWPLLPTSKRCATCLAFIIQLHDCRRRKMRRRRCRTGRCGRGRLNSCGKIRTLRECWCICCGSSRLPLLLLPSSFFFLPSIFLLPSSCTLRPPSPRLRPRCPATAFDDLEVGVQTHLRVIQHGATRFSLSWCDWSKNL